jgi:hypothetical protein
VSGYFPFVSDLKKFLDFRSEPDLGGFKPSSAQATCQKCGGTGWRDATRPVDKNRKVARCVCRAERVSK